MPRYGRDDGLVEIALPQKIQQRTDRAAPIPHVVELACRALTTELTG